MGQIPVTIITNRGPGLRCASTRSCVLSFLCPLCLRTCSGRTAPLRDAFCSRRPPCQSDASKVFLAMPGSATLLARMLIPGSCSGALLLRDIDLTVLGQRLPASKGLHHCISMAVSQSFHTLSSLNGPCRKKIWNFAKLRPCGQYG